MITDYRFSDGVENIDWDEVFEAMGTTGVSDFNWASVDDYRGTVIQIEDYGILQVFVTNPPTDSAAYNGWLAAKSHLDNLGIEVDWRIILINDGGHFFNNDDGSDEVEQIANWLTDLVDQKFPKENKQ